MENGGKIMIESDFDIDMDFVPDFESEEENFKQSVCSGADKTVAENPNAYKEDDERKAEMEEDEQNQQSADMEKDEHNADLECDAELERLKIKLEAMEAVRKLERTVNAILTIDQEIKKLDKLQKYYEEALAKPPADYNAENNPYIWVRQKTPEELSAQAEKASTVKSEYCAVAINVEAELDSEADRRTPEFAAVSPYWPNYEIDEE